MHPSEFCCPQHAHHENKVNRSQNRLVSPRSMESTSHKLSNGTKIGQNGARMRSEREVEVEFAKMKVAGNLRRERGMARLEEEDDDIIRSNCDLPPQLFKNYDFNLNF